MKGPIGGCLPRIFGACVLAAVLCALPARSGMAAGLEWSLVFVQEPTAAGTRNADRQGEGSRIAMLLPDGTVSVLTGDFAAAAEPCVSFDGERILFAAIREPTDDWDIWEMELDGLRTKRITQDLGDCREPIYLPRAAVDSPNFKNKVRWITFTSTAPSALNDQGDAALTSLYAMNLEPAEGRGVILWRTTYNLGGDIAPTVLSDGRVLFSARQRGAFALMTISWAGEDLNPFYGSHDRTISQTEACELTDRRVIFIESDWEKRDRGGWLAQVSLRRPLKSHGILSQGDGTYRTPQPLPGGELLVSWRGGAGTYGIYRFDLAAGHRGATIYDDPEWNEIDAMPVAPRPEPTGRIPMVEFASVLDVGSLKGLGQLQCLNVHDSDRPEAEHIERGQVKKVRLVEGVPVPSSGEASARLSGNPGNGGQPDSTWPPPGVATRLLGEAPVEEDGSFYVNVAGNVPFYMQILDAQGDALQTMRAWTWIRAGDQRGCIGCHEDKELAPENRATQALIRARPITLAVPPEERPTIRFGKDGSLIVTEQPCSGCHLAGASAAGGR